MSITLKGRLCETFGHVKNSRLEVTQGMAEDQSGHIHWAYQQDISRIQNEIQKDIDTVLNIFETNGINKEWLDYTFAYMKSARQVITTGIAENIEGHLSWAREHDEDVLRREIEKEALVIKNNLEDDHDPFPVHIHAKSNLGNGRFMETEIQISNNRRIDATTKIGSKSLLGFHGRVAVYFLDIAGNILWNSQEHEYGVNAYDQRIERWNEIIPEEHFDKIDRFTIIHSRSEKITATPEEINNWSQALGPIITAVVAS